ncbi:PhzF family phenazine biosynthesis protein [Achromobacter mucicolens]|uniref:PhzF family phenazine biosynthesis protein n=1 Tax=Achromobacter mucicolens TaxID=1389922 RepID=UPI00244C1CEF|nr:PhzF family phenazine biosynthesis protein [Achromobacter mucicolens]MDH0094776.1 PhzF family phenazine biosynthesis protein [Achromobacter mucicolens]
MASYAFRLLNVFADSTFSGNQLCVFEDARGMDDATMLNLAAQFNLSETTFILPSERADARVRVFTPGFEMKFAGHPAIGTAQVVRDLRQAEDAVTLEFQAGVVPMTAQGEAWTFTAPCPGGVRTAPPKLDPAGIAELVGLEKKDLLADPIWVDTGADQLLLPLAHVDAVRGAKPDASLLSRWQTSSLERKALYLFAFDEGNVQGGRQVVVSRYFYATPGGAINEDPGTGSACANLGGWLLHRKAALPASVLVEQGDQTGRPCRLLLDVPADGRILVGGRALEIGRGTVTL